MFDAQSGRDGPAARKITPRIGNFARNAWNAAKIKLLPAVEKTGAVLFRKTNGGQYSASFENPALALPVSSERDKTPVILPIYMSLTNGRLQKEEITHLKKQLKLKKICGTL